jgi:hypothetical protein
MSEETLNKVFADPSTFQRKYPEQRLQISHRTDDSFQKGGFYRNYVLYRDLKLTPETGHLIDVHVLKPIWPCTDVNRKPHLHDSQIFLAYILKGWMKIAFEGHGEHLMQEGSAWNQSGVKHQVIDFSEDCELMEICMPANFDTLNVKFNPLSKT